MAARPPIDRETVSRMSLREIGELLVSYKLIEPCDVPHMTLKEMRAMLAYLSGVRPDPGRSVG